MQQAMALNNQQDYRKRQQTKNIILARQIMEERRKNNIIYSFKPNPGAQEDFFTKGHYKDEHDKYQLINTRVLFGGNKYGKTTTVAVEAHSFAIGERVWFPINSPFRYTPYRPPVEILIISRPTLIKDDIIPALDKWIPKDLILKKEKKAGTGEIESYLYKNGSRIKLMSYDQEDENFEGIAKHLVIFNEPCPRNIYIACMRGQVVHGGYTMLAMTLLNQTWVEDEIINKADGKEIIAFKGNIRENKHLTPEFIERFGRTLSEEEREIRMEGNSIVLQGLVYKKFNEYKDVYIFDPDKLWNTPELKGEPPLNWTNYFVADPHDRRPMACIWAAVDELDDIYVWKEYPFVEFHTAKYDGLTIENISKLFLEIENGRNIFARLMDITHGNKTLPNTKKTIKQEFASHGIYFKDAPNCPEDNRRALRDFLWFDESNPISAQNKPKIFISKNCHNLIYGMTHYMWDDWTDRAMEKRDVKEKPQDKHKCFPNCLEYLAFYNPINQKNFGTPYIPEIKNKRLGI